MKKSIKMLAVLAAALLIWIQMSTTVLASETPGYTAGGRGSSTSAPETGEQAEEPEIEYFDELETQNRISTTLFIAGGACVFAGVCGFIGMIIWRRRHRDHSKADKKRILSEIRQAEQRVKEEQRAQAEQPLSVTGSVNLYDMQEDDFNVPQEGPIVPTTPVSMQPEMVRPRVQPVVPHPAAPVREEVQPEKPIVPQPAEKPIVPQKAVYSPVEKPIVPQKAETPVTPPVLQPAPQPAVQPAPAAEDEFDLEEILREVREGLI